MTAKEMFEELGYVLNEDTNDSFDYEFSDDDFYWKEIRFDKNLKTVYCHEFYGELKLDIPTLKAIIKQCEELGWLDE